MKLNDRRSRERETWARLMLIAIYIIISLGSFSGLRRMLWVPDRCFYTVHSLLRFLLPCLVHAPRGCGNKSSRHTTFRKHLSSLELVPYHFFNASSNFLIPLFHCVARGLVVGMMFLVSGAAFAKRARDSFSTHSE